MKASGLMCPRVVYRMECPECVYPLSESLVKLDVRLPHLLTECEDLIQGLIEDYDCELTFPRR